MPEIEPLNYPSNSIERKVTQEKSDAPRKVAPVAKGTVIKKKKSFFNTFFGETLKSVGEYILWEILIPAAKDVVSDTASKGVDMLVYGEVRGGRGRTGGRDTGGAHINYVGYSQPIGSAVGRTRDEPRSIRPVRSVQDIYWTTKQEASDVLDQLVDFIDKYNVVSVADFYDFAGVTGGDYTDNHYGWENLRSASVMRIREGYIIDLPRPVAIR